MTASAATIDCRLCGSPSHLKFSRSDADGSKVSCYECAGCRSLQTETPTWLASEYARSARPDFLNLDTYAADRTQRGRTAAYFLWRFGGFARSAHKLLDFGGGVGLMVRLLRDVGVDAHLYDKYAFNHYASGFAASEAQHYEVVTAFEVLEHLPNPSVDLEAIFGFDPSLLVISTCLYSGQGPDWPYLGPPKSEHVFFYSNEALHLIAARFGYAVMPLRNDVALFYRAPVGRLRLRLVAALLSRNRLAELLFALLQKPNCCDHDNRLVGAMIGTQDGRPLSEIPTKGSS